MTTTNRFHASLGVATLAALAIASSARGQSPAPRELNGASFERPPGAAKSPPPENFPDLKQDAAGNWLVGFEHLASFPFGRQRVNNEAPLKAKVLGLKNLDLVVPDETNPVEMPTEPGQSGVIPASVLALDGKKVRISGYMLPVKIENGLVKECLLLRNQLACCYGRQPELNEWVVVKMPGQGVPGTMDTPISFYGTLHVGEIFDNGVFTGLYRLDGEKTSSL